MHEDSIGQILWKFIRKFFLSAFVIFTFVAYVLHERFSNAPADQAALTPEGETPSQPAVVANPTAIQLDPLPTAPPSIFQPAPSDLPTQPPPTAIPTDTPVAQGQYKNGEFVGPEVDAFYGLVQVKATIQNGQIAAVDFLEFPSDRRTSQRINAVAVPYLKMEAVQAQSANVNVISGATLTSEAFMMSLQSALDAAKR